MSAFEVVAITDAVVVVVDVDVVVAEGGFICSKLQIMFFLDTLLMNLIIDGVELGELVTFADKTCGEPGVCELID